MKRIYYKKQLTALACMALMMLITGVSACSTRPSGESKRNSRLTEADRNLEKAYELYDSTQFDRSIDLTQEALKVYKEHNDTLAMSDAYSNLSACYQRLGITDSALQYSLAGLNIELKLRDDELLSSTYNNLGAIYLAANRPREAKGFFLKAIEKEKSLNSPKKLSIRYAGAAEVFLKLKDNDKALEYINNAFNIDSTAADTTHMARRLAVMGDIYTAREDYNIALKRYNEAIEMLTRLDDKYSLMITLKSLGGLYEKLNNTSQALECYNKSLKIAQDCDARKFMQLNCSLMAGLLSKENPAKALKYMIMSDSLKDSIFSETTGQLTTQYAMQFESQQKQITIEEQQHAIATQRLIIIVVSIAVLLLLLGCGALFMINLLRAKAQHAEKKAEQMKEAFFTNVTHEFRTPLTVILGETDLLKQRDDNPNRQLIYDAITDQGNLLLELVNKLLNISKVRASQDSIKWKNGDVEAMVKMIIENMRVSAERKGIGIGYSSDNGNYNIDFVPEYCQSILTNLIANSLKFTGKGGKISILLTRTDDKASLAITDTGCGIKEKDLPHIFEPFYQGDSQNFDSGTGIGLSLVKQMAEAMNGNIEVQSSEGQGTTITVTLPVKHEEGGYPKWVPRILSEPFGDRNDDNEEKAHDNEKVSNGDDKPMVLVIEDNHDVAMFIEHVLEDRYNVIHASNGNDGLKKAKELVPDIILTDLMMPECDGYELCRKVRADEIINHVPIVIVTARSLDNDRVKAVNAGADAYITKPFSNSELAAVVDNLLKRREMLKLKYELETKLQDDMNSSVQVEKANYIANVNAKNDAFMLKVNSIIKENINNPEMGSLFLAGKMNLSQRQFNRKVKSIISIDTASYIREMRIDLAQEMLRNSDDPVTEIAEKCGFESGSYFSKIFKRVTGNTPSDYRKKFR